MKSTPNAIHWIRDVKLDAIEAVGFDLDFTLAPYDAGRVTQLTTEEAAQRLGLRASPESCEVGIRRGDLIDTTNAVLIRTDPFGVALDAWNLERHLKSTEIEDLYGADGPIAPGGRFQPVDSFYAFADALLFLHLAQEHSPGVTPVQCWRRTRSITDKLHAEGYLYKQIAESPATFIPPDYSAAPILAAVRDSGRSAFLITNAPPSYAEAILEAIGLDDCAFDFAVFESSKPDFFRSSTILNPLAGHHARFATRTYIGGSLKALEQQQHLAGRDVLYVGDHVYGDIIRASRLRAWRTLLVIPELNYSTGSPFRTPTGTLTHFGWQVVRFAWGYSVSASAVTDMDQYAHNARFEIKLPHETKDLA